MSGIKCVVQGARPSMTCNHDWRETWVNGVDNLEIHMGLTCLKCKKKRLVQV